MTTDPKPAGAEVSLAERLRDEWTSPDGISVGLIEQAAERIEQLERELATVAQALNAFMRATQRGVKGGIIDMGNMESRCQFYERIDAARSQARRALAPRAGATEPEAAQEGNKSPVTTAQVRSENPVSATAYCPRCEKVQTTIDDGETCAVCKLVLPAPTELEQCSYCKQWYPKPVSYHHSEDECK